MIKEQRNDLLDHLHALNPNASGVFFDPKDLIFEENVRMNCFYCGRYGRNWRCPPHLPAVDFQKMVKEFDCGMFVSVEYDIVDAIQAAAVRTESSVVLHRLLLSLESWLYNQNSSNALSFIGGSCKLCKGGCGKDGCNNPYLSRSPVESTGINIVKSAKKYGIEITFPTDKKLMRMGMILWQEE